MENSESKEVVLFESSDKSVSLSVPMDGETVWLNRNQMAELFDRDVKTIGKHINNAFEEELEFDAATVANFATVQKEGDRTVERQIEYYSLDVIISVGYRVKSKRGTEFRKWANSVLKQYILKGYAANDTRLSQLKQTLQIIRRLEQNPESLDKNQILSVVESYTSALDLLDDYDHQVVAKPEGNSATYVLTYDECRKVIESMRFAGESTMFGNEKDDSFKGSIGAIYQTFGGKDVYPSLQEKAANLLYFVTKNHSFSDGNKRIAATMFLYFLDKNNWLFENGQKRIGDHALVALTIMIAESKPQEKEIMINLVMNFLE
ncbi:MAG: virulence protein RhuM/Fic/DOC family protein [Treponema sp.]|nr:virulence protein RhuM/Fic/DOC family protein [Candidatus Treponema equifaecale]